MFGEAECTDTDNDSLHNIVGSMWQGIKLLVFCRQLTTQHIYTKAGTMRTIVRPIQEQRVFEHTNHLRMNTEELMK